MDISITASGGTFIRTDVEPELNVSRLVRRYFWKAAESADLTEITEEEWFEQLKTDAPNFYSAEKNRGIRDCHIIKKTTQPENPPK